MEPVQNAKTDPSRCLTDILAAQIVCVGPRKMTKSLMLLRIVLDRAAALNWMQCIPGVGSQEEEIGLANVEVRRE
jgi:hypothetical protein